MAAMDSLNHDTYTVNSESDKISLNVSLLPLTSSASNINVQSVEVSTQSLTDKTLYTALPEMTTSDNSNNYVLINLQELQDKVSNNIKCLEDFKQSLKQILLNFILDTEFDVIQHPLF